MSIISKAVPRLSAPPGVPSLRNMVWVPGGTFLMGSNDHYAEEAPAHHVKVDGFWMDEHPVTVSEFRRFVKETNYVTIAERPLDPKEYPGADPALLVPGSLVFQKTTGPVDLKDYRNWWYYQPGASWRVPAGPHAPPAQGRHPVVHVAWEDVAAYAAWAEKEVPAEAEWEFAARGGLHGAIYTWGNEFAPKGRMMANTWQGEFPYQNLRQDGFEGTSPVRSFAANGYGLYDMAGNVWEWTSDYYTPRHPDDVTHSCCVPQNPRVESAEQSHMSGPGEQFPRHVIKGGSHLCAPNYCLRYRPAARQAQTVETSMAHLGFRCIIRQPRAANT